MTNILSLPLAEIDVSTGNNEDWIDSLKYVVDDGSADPPQLDLEGISFAMEVRRSPEDHEVLLSASTDDGKLALGDPPDVGFLLITIPLAEMKVIAANDYVADIVATADGYARRCIAINLTVVEGVTK